MTLGRARPARLCRHPALEECEREMREAVAFHIDGVRESGQPVPEPSRVIATYVDVAA